MNTLYNKSAKKNLFKSLVVASLFLTSCTNSCNRDDITHINNIDNNISIEEHCDSLVQNYFPVDSIKGDTVFKDGNYVISPTLAEVISAYDLLQNGESNANNDSLNGANNDTYNEANSNSSNANGQNGSYNNSQSTYNRNNSVNNSSVSDANALDSLVSDIDVDSTNANVNATVQAPCDTCLTIEQAVFNSVNERYKNK